MNNKVSIKYRVFDTKRKKIRYDINIMIDSLGNIYKVQNLGDCLDFELVKFPIMQSTLLFDINNKEIYTGDICNDGSVVTQLGNRYVLMYTNGEYEDLIGNVDEVIGDIFRNPSLIK